MRFLRRVLMTMVVVACAATVSFGQSTTGTIRGQVTDSQGLGVPGATVTASSPNLQGQRQAVTSENGDYVLTGLPSGPYTVAFELSGFERQQRSVTLAPTQDVPLSVQLGLASLSEQVTVLGKAADVLTGTAQVATNLNQAFVAALPTNRDINAYLLLAPSVHGTGPNGAYSIAGSVSFENLFLVNGVTVNETLRGQANDLYIEDAIQETTISTAGISSEYGRFGGGVVNVVTKSGGNEFSGSFRETLYNDKWRTLTPFEDAAIAADPARRELRLNKVVPTHEYTVGGPVLKDRLWFFTAGRIQTQSDGRTLVATNIPYAFQRPTKRFEAKGTYSVANGHRIQSGYTRIIDEQINNTFNTAASMDLNSLETRKTPQDLFVVNYSGAVGAHLFVEGLFSKRQFTFKGSGARSTDLIDGTLMVDAARGLRYWSATFCGVCDTESRDNDDVYGKATYFWSTRNRGSHSIVVGGDRFNDIIRANNHQSGSDYRILGTTSIVRGTGADAVIYPQLLPGSTVIQWNPIPIDSRGSNFTTYAAFVNDSWRINLKMTANVGLRWDKNRGRDQQGNLVANDSALSPRLGVIIDPRGDGRWSVTGSFAQYVPALNSSIGDSASSAGNAQDLRFMYRGPAINPDPSAANLTATPAAIRQVFDWYFENGGPSLPFQRQPSIPGVSPRIGDNLTSPNVLEYASGVSRTFGSRATLRADVVYRNYRNFYVERMDLSTGRVANALGDEFDLSLFENDTEGVLERRYAGLTGQATYRFKAGTDVGITYTASRAWGNFNGETVAGGPTAPDVLTYPEYRQASWNYPDGSLQIDQRHRARFWLNYGVPKVEGLTISLLQSLESGVPFGPNNITNTNNANGVDASAFVDNPGYLTPPDGTVLYYHFAADCANVPASPAYLREGCVNGAQRDAFRLEGQVRTDLAFNYGRRVSVGSRRPEFFVQAHIVNLFDQSQICGCGGTVFENGGTVRQTRVDQTVRTAVTSAATFQSFDPFTTTPVQGVHWNYGPRFGQPLNRLAYTTPRQFRMTFGVRF